MRVSRTRIAAEVTQTHAVIHFLITHVREPADAQRIEDEIESVAEQHKPKLIIVNFSRLQQMTSSMLSRLITLNKALRQQGIALHLCEMNAEVEKAFRICKLEKVIPLFKTEDEATTL